MSLLEKVKSYKVGEYRKSKFNEDERIEVSLAWLKGEVRITQVIKAIGGGTTAYTYLAVGLKRAYEQGLIKLS